MSERTDQAAIAAATEVVCATTGVWYSDDLSTIRIDGAWRIVHTTFYRIPPGES